MKAVAIDNIFAYRNPALLVLAEIKGNDWGKSFHL
jgi:hypothetical protein